MRSKLKISFHWAKILEIIAYLSVLLLISGFLFNRVLNNCGLFFAGVHAVYYFKYAWKKSWKPWIYILLAVVTLPFLYDLLCCGTIENSRNVMKWSLFVYPLFFISTIRYRNFLKHAMMIFLAGMLVSTIYSVVHYLLAFSEYNQLYGQAKVMKVLAYQDHIRVGWASAISVLVSALLGIAAKGKKERLFYILYAVIQVGFVHLLGSKTGWVVLYTIAIFSIVWILIKYSKRIAVLMAIAVFTLPILAYIIFPTVRQRIAFIHHDFYYYSKDNYQPGLSDALRVYSLKAGMDIIKRHLFLGVGFTEIDNEMDQWYSAHTPFLPKEERFPPSSQLIEYWAAGGLVSFLVLILFLIIPCWNASFRDHFGFMAFLISSGVTFLFEVPLDAQLSIFVYGFSLGLFYALTIKENHLDLDLPK